MHRRDTRDSRASRCFRWTGYLSTQLPRVGPARGDRSRSAVSAGRSQRWRPLLALRPVRRHWSRLTSKESSVKLCARKCRHSSARSGAIRWIFPEAGVEAVHRLDLGGRGPDSRLSCSNVRARRLRAAGALRANTRRTRQLRILGEQVVERGASGPHQPEHDDRTANRRRGLLDAWRSRAAPAEAQAGRQQLDQVRAGRRVPGGRAAWPRDRRRRAETPSASAIGRIAEIVRTPAARTASS